MKKNIVRIKAPAAPVSPSKSAPQEASQVSKSSASLSEASEMNRLNHTSDESEEFLSRPWVNVKPSFPWRPALAVLSVLVLVVVVAIFIKPEVEAHTDPEADIALMAEAMPKIDRHGDGYEEDVIADSESTDESVAEDGEAVPETERLKTLIVKVSDQEIRANGKLVNLNDLGEICKMTEDNATLKLINRRGDTKLVEAVARVLESSQLRYHYVNN